MCSGSMPCCSKRFNKLFTLVQTSRKSFMSTICDPMWKCRPIKRMCFNTCSLSMVGQTWSMGMPNLFSARPVVIFACVWAATLGLTRRHTSAVRFSSLQSCSITSSSSMLSTLKQKMPFSKASFISQSFLPTPANTMLSPLKPARNAASISPPLTQSTPNPASFIVCKMRLLALAFTA